MTPTLLIILSLVVFLPSAIITLVNFCRGFKDVGEFFEGNGLFVHILGGAVSSFSFVIFVIGLVWFFLEKYAQ